MSKKVTEKNNSKPTDPIQEKDLKLADNQRAKNFVLLKRLLMHLFSLLYFFVCLYNSQTVRLA